MNIRTGLINKTEGSQTLWRKGSQLMDDLQLGRPELAAIIGQRLRDVRRARGLSQQALAEGLFSKGYVSSIEHGKIFPSVRALQALAARLGVDMSEFFDPALLAAQARPAPEGPDAADVRRNSLALLEVAALAAAGAPTALARLRQVDPDALTPPERVQLHYAVAQAQLTAGNPNAALGELHQALSLVDTEDDAEADPEVTQEVHALMGEVLLARGQAALAADHLQRAYQVLQDSPTSDPALRLQVLSSLARAYNAQGDTARARNTYQDAVQLAQEIGSVDRLTRVLAGLSRQATENRDWVRAERYGTEAVLLSEVHQTLRRAMRTQLDMGRLLGTLGEGAVAQERLDAGLQMAQQLGDDAAQAGAYAQLAELALQAGRVDEAADAVRAAQAAAERSKDRRTQAQARYVAGLLDQARGEAAQADSAFREAIATLEELDDRDLLGQAYFAYARALTERGQAADAAGYFEKAYLARTGA
jgi:transcriptional regulator with XRE-family HTH domain